MELKEEQGRVFQPKPVDLRHGLYNGRRHYVYNARGEQVGTRRLKDMPGQPRKRWETPQAFAKRSMKPVVSK